MVRGEYTSYPASLHYGKNIFIDNIFVVAVAALNLVYIFDIGTTTISGCVYLVYE